MIMAVFVSASVSAAAAASAVASASGNLLPNASRASRSSSEPSQLQAVRVGRDANKYRFQLLIAV